MQYKGNLLLHLVLISITLIGSIVFFVLESIWNCSYKPKDLAISYSLIGFILLGVCLFTAVMICCKITEPSMSQDNSIASASDSHYFYIGGLQNTRHDTLDNSSIKNDYNDRHRKMPIQIHSSNFNRLMETPVDLHEQRYVAGRQVQQLESSVAGNPGNQTVASSSRTNVGQLNIPKRISDNKLEASKENQSGIY